MRVLSLGVVVRCQAWGQGRGLIVRCSLRARQAGVTSDPIVYSSNSRPTHGLCCMVRLINERPSCSCCVVARNSSANRAVADRMEGSRFDIWRY